MSPEQQRIAIAKFCKFTAHYIDLIPDYLSDLNATMKVCSLLAKQGWRCVANMGTDGTWECFFTKRHQGLSLPGLGDHYGAGDTLALALVEAILLTIEQERKRQEIDDAFIRAGHKPENTNCDHSQYIREKHGRYCPCGTCMWDAGD